MPRIKKGAASTGAPGYTGGEQLIHNRKDSPAAAAASSWLRFGAGNERPLGSSCHVPLPGLVQFAINATERFGRLAAFAARRGLNTARSLLFVVSEAVNRPAGKEDPFRVDRTSRRGVGLARGPFVVGRSQRDGRLTSRGSLARAVEPAQVLRGGVPPVRAFQVVNGLQSRQSCLGSPRFSHRSGDHHPSHRRTSPPRGET